jgi:3-hydroxyisobutyrate dehydrogenase-like beta-hydroxyacid dehydrogenase
MSDVSVIGTGAMGRALVQALVASGANVTVWNRTKSKVEALAGPRVHVAESVAHALSSSPVSIMSVSDHQVARVLVEAAGTVLDGKVVASTSFVTPEQAYSLAAVVETAGGAYLDLEIIASPTQVRSGAGVFLVSGSREAHEAHRAAFERIGSVTFIDGGPASAYTNGMAVTLAYLPMAVGLLQGIRIARAHDLSPDAFTRAVLDLYPLQIGYLLDRVGVMPVSSEVEASVDQMGAWAAEYGAALRDMNLDTGVYDALHRLFTAASAAGHGKADWTCVAEHVATG